MSGALHPVAGVPLGRGGDTEDAPEEEDMGRERRGIGEMRHRPRDTEGGGHHQELEEAGGVLPEPPEGVQPCPHLDFGRLAFTAVEGYISVVSSPPVPGHLSGRPQGTNTAHSPSPSTVKRPASLIKYHLQPTTRESDLVPAAQQP